MQQVSQDGNSLSQAGQGSNLESLRYCRPQKQKEDPGTPGLLYLESKQSEIRLKNDLRCNKDQQFALFVGVVGTAEQIP